MIPLETQPPHIDAITPEPNRTKTASLLAGLLIACFLLSPATLFAENTQKTITFSCLFPQKSKSFRRLENLYRQSFGELGYEFQMLPLSENDILNGLAVQQYDGDCARTHAMFNNSTHQNYALVDTSSASVQISVYGEHTIEERRLDQLQAVTQPGSELSVRLAKHYGISLVASVTSTDEVWQLFQDDTIDAYISLSAQFPSQSEAVDNLDIGPEYTLARYPAYPVLHKRWKDLTPIFQRVLERRIRAMASNKPLPNTNAFSVGDLPYNTVVFSCPVSQDTGVFLSLVEFYSAAFQRLGFQFRMISMSRDREAFELINNKVDGSCGRINFPVLHRNAPVRVPIVVSEDEFEVWGEALGPRVESLQDIPQGSSIGYRQSLLTESQINSAQHLNFTPKNLVEETLQSLTLGQNQYIVDLQIQIDTSISNVALTKPIYYQGSIGRVQVVPYLSQKRKKLLHPLTRELRAVLGENGTWSEIVYPKWKGK